MIATFGGFEADSSMKSTTKKTPARKPASRSTRRKPIRKWARTVKTESTFPPPGTFTKPAEELARIMATRKVSPGGIGSAIKMVQMFINRGGRKLSADRKKELEKAKRILQRKLRPGQAKS
jgi:Protein of unknown function (DUF3175)